MIDEDVLIITHPLGAASENHVASLLDIIAALTGVTLVTANLSEDSTIRDAYDVIDLTHADTGPSIHVAAGRFLMNQLRMCLTIARRDDQVVLFFGATTYLLPIITAKLFGRTVIIEPRGDVPLTLQLQWEKRLPAILARGLSDGLRLIESLGYRVADIIVTYTPSMASELGLDRFEEKLLPIGARAIDTETFSPRIAYSDRGCVVGFLGRLDEEKGVRTLALVAKRLPDDITFKFVGDGSLRGWLETELHEEIDDGTVEVVGWVDHSEVPDHLNRLRLLVMASAPTEGLPTTIVEAMACGTPVYATPVAGVPDIVQEGDTGFLIADQDPDEIVNGIAEIIERSDLNDISRAARELIEAEYSFDAAVRRYREILTTAIEDG